MPGDDDLKKTVEDIASYPILTEEVSFPATTRPGLPGTGGGAPLGQIVESALRGILGWRPKASDPKGFVAALQQSFISKEVDGRRKWEWTPHSYAVQADMGAVTGAQASIYKRAKVALDQSLPLLDELQPLRADADSEDSEAIRAIVRSGLIELVNELGVQGGPRVARVEGFLELLLGDGPRREDPEQVEGQLGLLRDRFGLQRQQVNTIEEEQTLTNFIILVDSVNSLSRTWKVQRHFFDRQGTDVFLGTQLELLSRSLAVVAESVEGVYFAMNSVFLGPAERQVTPLNTHPPLFVGELLAWVERFASEEGRRLIREGGKDGVIHAFTPTARRLQELVQRAWEESKQSTGNPTRGFHTPRVQRALEELTAHLYETLTLADQIRRLPRPDITSVYPDHASIGGPVRVTVDGANFQDGATVKFNRSGASDIQITGRTISVIGTKVINAIFDLSVQKAQANTEWTVVVINPDGGCDWKERAFKTVPNPDEQHGTLQPFTVRPPTPRQELTVVAVEPASGLSVVAVEPASGRQGQTVRGVQIEGTYFQSGDISVNFGEEIRVSSINVISPTQLTANISINRNAKPGPRNVTVDIRDIGSAAKPNGFTVLPVE